jgi:hypothetical protein
VADLKEKGENKSETYCFCLLGCLAGDWEIHRQYEREEKKETIPIHQFAGLRRRRHVDPRAASVPADSRRLPCSSCYF